MKNKKVLVLGAGVYQKPLIVKAKEMGHTVLVVSPKGAYPGIFCADIWFEEDTTNINAVLELAIENKIDAVITTGTDVCMPTLGRLVDKLDLVGVSYESAIKCMDKVLMKEAFSRYRVPTAKFNSFTEVEEAKIFADNIGLPLMVKASDSSGSRGVIKVSSRKGLDSAINNAFKVSRNKKIIVEEFLDGVEFGAQVLISSGKIMKIIPHGDILNKGKITTPIGHFMPFELDHELKQVLIEVVSTAVKSLSIDNCIANIDFMLVNNIPYIIEIGARMGATCLPENISYFYNEDIYSYMIQMALGEDVIFKENTRRPNASVLITSEKSGIIKSIFIPDFVKNNPNLIELTLDVNVGDKIRSFQIGPDRLGHLIVSGNTAEEAINLAEKLQSNIIIQLYE